MNEFWIVRFIRRDGKPNEEYYYSSQTVDKVVFDR